MGLKTLSSWVFISQEGGGKCEISFENAGFVKTFFPSIVGKSKLLGCFTVEIKRSWIIFCLNLLTWGLKFNIFYRMM